MNTENDSDLVKFQLIKKEQLSEDEFFKDFIKRSYENKLIDDDLIARINNERLASLKVLLKYYTKDSSSSVMTECAESLLQSIDYTAAIYLKKFDTIDEMIEELKNNSMKTILKKGNRLIKLNVNYCRKLLLKIKAEKLNVNNYSYNDTIDYGIDKFFKTYDDFFCAQGGEASIDYQTAIYIGDYLGVEFIRKYLERLNLENEFCHNFEEENIKKLLYSYDEKSELLLISIFEIILTNCIGLIFCSKDIKLLNINKADKEIIRNNLIGLSIHELEQRAIEACRMIIKELNIENEELITYIIQCSNKIADRLYDNLNCDTLNSIFISFQEKEKKIIKYIDKEKLSNKNFRKVTEEIRKADSIREKFEIINMNIRSLADLNDMLDSECLFDDEYEKFFSRLSQIQIILLSKYIDEYGKQREWHEKFNPFIRNINNYKKIKDSIMLI